MSTTNSIIIVVLVILVFILGLGMGAGFYAKRYRDAARRCNEAEERIDDLSQKLEEANTASTVPFIITSGTVTYSILADDNSSWLSFDNSVSIEIIPDTTPDGTGK